jgi:hypothetical protein
LPRPLGRYIANRTKGNFYKAIQAQNFIAHDHEPTKEDKKNFLSSMNSYLGIMKHYKTYNLRRKFLIKHLSPAWLKYVYYKNNACRIVVKKGIIPKIY